MKWILQAFLIFSTSLASAQLSIMEDDLNWAEWETVGTGEIKMILDEVVKTAEKLPPYIVTQYVNGRNLDSFHLMDVNGDSQQDILFNGPIGNGDGVIVLLGVGTEYIISNILRGNIIGTERSKLSGLIEFKIVQNPVNSGDEHYRLIVHLSIRPNDVKLITATEYSYKTKTEIPTAYFPPKPFIVTTSHYNLRAQPIFDSTSNDWAENISGNVVAIYPQGSVGKAIAEKIDANGRAWWFVIMENNIPPTRSLLVYRQPTNMSIGWMSCRFLREIKP